MSALHDSRRITQFDCPKLSKNDFGDLNLGCYGRELLPDALGCTFANPVGISENANMATPKLFNIICEKIDARTERGHYTNIRKSAFGVGKMLSGQRVLATFNN